MRWPNEVAKKLTGVSVRSGKMGCPERSGSYVRSHTAEPEGSLMAGGDGCEPGGGDGQPMCGPQALQ